MHLVVQDNHNLPTGLEDVEARVTQSSTYVHMFFFLSLWWVLFIAFGANWKFRLGMKKLDLKNKTSPIVCLHILEEACRLLVRARAHSPKLK